MTTDVHIRAKGLREILEESARLLERHQGREEQLQAAVLRGVAALVPEDGVLISEQRADAITLAGSVLAERLAAVDPGEEPCWHEHGVDIPFSDCRRNTPRCPQDVKQDEDSNVSEGWIQTFTLRKFYPLAPRREDVALEDIAHALSLQYRYTGHVHHFYSVAEHSVRVSLLAEQLAPPELKELAARWGLLHDASEAYLIDVARPVKRTSTMAPYRAAESRLQAVICEAFGLSPEEPACVKEADKILGATEARDLFPSVHPEWTWAAEQLPGKIQPFSPAEAEGMFLARFHELWGMNPPEPWLWKSVLEGER